ncbi:hypothetical protein LZ32DRAFT_48020 [Colletotrichum eremochloae]|nr:hypothetical protein LZ32DRAFT_48020 [Colletotrichum eremochloae]
MHPDSHQAVPCTRLAMADWSVPAMCTQSGRCVICHLSRRPLPVGSLSRVSINRVLQPQDHHVRAPTLPSNRGRLDQATLSSLIAKPHALAVHTLLVSLLYISLFLSLLYPGYQDLLLARVLLPLQLLCGRPSFPTR